MTDQEIQKNVNDLNDFGAQLILSMTSNERESFLTLSAFERKAIIFQGWAYKNILVRDKKNAQAAAMTELAS